MYLAVLCCKVLMKLTARLCYKTTNSVLVSSFMSPSQTAGNDASVFGS